MQIPIQHIQPHGKLPAHIQITHIHTCRCNQQAQAGTYIQHSAPGVPSGCTAAKDRQPHRNPQVQKKHSGSLQKEGQQGQHNCRDEGLYNPQPAAVPVLPDYQAHRNAVKHHIPAGQRLQLHSQDHAQAEKTCYDPVPPLSRQTDCIHFPCQKSQRQNNRPHQLSGLSQDTAALMGNPEHAPHQQKHRSTPKKQTMSPLFYLHNLPILSFFPFLLLLEHTFPLFAR